MINEKQFINNMIKREQSELVAWIPTVLRKMGMEKVYSSGQYIFGLGDIPVLLVCHLDTVHKQVPKTVLCDKGMMWSPEGIGGDDRCGVYALIEVVKRMPVGKRPYVLFTTDEEIGGIGAKAFTKDFPENEWGIKFAIEYDRKGYNDLCFYSTYNDEFIDYVINKTGYVEAHGSYTDIVELMYDWDLAGVNMSVGYYNAHTVSEYIVLKHLQRAVDITLDWLLNEDWDTVPVFTAMSGDRYQSKSYTSYFGNTYDDGGWSDPDLCDMCGCHLLPNEADRFEGCCEFCYTDATGTASCPVCGELTSCEELSEHGDMCRWCLEDSTEVELPEQPEQPKSLISNAKWYNAFKLF